MKKMRNSLLATALLAFVQFFAINVWAGGSAGNGGQSLVCFDAAGKSLAGSTGGSTISQSYDLYEGEKLFGYTYNFAADASAVELALKVAKKLDSLPYKGGMSFADRVTKIVLALESAKDETDMQPTEDILATYLPQNCALVQVIVFHADQTISVNLSAFQQLSAHAQAALYLHEAIFWYLRDTAGDTSSRRTRRIVSYLLSGGDPRIALQGTEGYDPAPVSCSQRGSSQDESTTLFLLVDPAGRTEVVVPTKSTEQKYRIFELLGAEAGLSLVSDGRFAPSQNVLLRSAATAPINLKLSLGVSGQADLSVQRTGHADVHLSLQCTPDNDPLPISF